MDKNEIKIIVIDTIFEIFSKVIFKDEDDYLYWEISKAYDQVLKKIEEDKQAKKET